MWMNYFPMPLFLHQCSSSLLVKGALRVTHIHMSNKRCIMQGIFCWGVSWFYSSSRLSDMHQINKFRVLFKTYLKPFRIYNPFVAVIIESAPHQSNALFTIRCTKGHNPKPWSAHCGSNFLYGMERIMSVEDIKTEQVLINQDWRAVIHLAADKIFYNILF